MARVGCLIMGEFDAMSYILGSANGVSSVVIESDMTFADDGSGDIVITEGEK